jgi:hypothetical protein
MSEKMTVTTAGNVGIGTTAPTEKLDVTGSIKMVDGNQAAGKLMVSDAAGKGTWTDAATALSGSTTASKWTNDATNTLVKLTNLSDNTTARPAGKEFVVTDAGNVGIGTATPIAPLDLVGNFHLSSGATIYGAGSTFLRAGSGGILHLGSNDANSHMVINNGNVGIGTTTPRAKLDVRNGSIIASSATATNGSTIIEGYYDQDTTGGSTAVMGTSYSTGGLVLGYGLRPSNTTPNEFFSAFAHAGGRSALVNDHQGFHLFSGAVQTVAIGSPLTMSEKMTVTTAGNVGIGTTAPTSKLQVVGLPVHATNAAAITAGLTAGAFYHAGDGIVRVVF